MSDESSSFLCKALPGGALWALILCLLVLAACSPPDAQQSAPQVEDTGGPGCVPACQGRTCGGDGCGGVCGACPQGQRCDEQGQCVAPAQPGCQETCEGAGASCGEVCGQSCGSCPEGSRCEDGQCACQPDCVGKTCGESDGCGGACEPCPREVSCTDCPLVLQVVEREVVQGRLRAVTLAVDFQPSAQQEAPTVADLRLQVSGPVVLERVGLGEAMLEADKELVRSPSTGRPYQELSEGVLQFLVLSQRNTLAIPGGRWLFVRFLLGDTAQEGPAVFSLVKREQVLAPPSADSQLWTAAYDTPVVIWPEVQDAP